MKREQQDGPSESEAEVEVEVEVPIRTTHSPLPTPEAGQDLDLLVSEGFLHPPGERKGVGDRKGAASEQAQPLEPEIEAKGALQRGAQGAEAGASQEEAQQGSASLDEEAVLHKETATTSGAGAALDGDREGALAGLGPEGGTTAQGDPGSLQNVPEGATEPAAESLVLSVEPAAFIPVDAEHKDGAEASKDGPPSEAGLPLGKAGVEAQQLLAGATGSTQPQPGAEVQLRPQLEDPAGMATSDLPEGGNIHIAWYTKFGWISTCAQLLRLLFLHPPALHPWHVNSWWGRVHLGAVWNMISLSIRRM